MSVWGQEFLESVLCIKYAGMFCNIMLLFTVDFRKLAGFTHGV